MFVRLFFVSFEPGIMNGRAETAAKKKPAREGSASFKRGVTGFCQQMSCTPVGSCRGCIYLTGVKVTDWFPLREGLLKRSFTRVTPSGQ